MPKNINSIFILSFDIHVVASSAVMRSYCTLCIKSKPYMHGEHVLFLLAIMSKTTFTATYAYLVRRHTKYTFETIQ